MDEKTKADIYLAYLDRILEGEKDMVPVDEAEIKELLLLARTMIDNDFSVSTKTREKLRKQILAQVYKKNKSSLTRLPEDDEELEDEMLDYVAAGFAGQDEEQKDILKHLNLRGNQENSD